MKRLLTAILSVSLVIAILGVPMVFAGYPEKSVKLIIPYRPGGGTDAIFRIVINKAKEFLVKPIVPINMPGAGATKGSRYVKDAKPDGYTVLGSHDIIATAYYSGLADYSFSAFEPVCLLTATPNIVTVHADAPFDTIREMLDYAKKHPGKLVWTYSPGSTSYFFFRGIVKAAGVKPDLFREVSIEGTGKQTKNLLGKHVDVILSNVASGFEYVKEGRLKFLAIAHDKRTSRIPDVPTLKESGIDFVFATNRGVFAPKGTSQEKIHVLAEAFRKACASEELQKKIEEIGSIINYKSPEEYAPILDKLDAFYKGAMQ